MNILSYDSNKIKGQSANICVINNIFTCTNMEFGMNQNWIRELWELIGFF